MRDDAGCGMRDAGYEIWDARCGMQDDAGCGMQDMGYGMRDAGWLAWHTVLAHVARGE